MTDMPERIRMVARQRMAAHLANAANETPTSEALHTVEYIRADLAEKNADAAYLAGFEAAKYIIASGLERNAQRMPSMSGDRKVSGVIQLVSEFVLDACGEIRAITPPKREGETK